MSELSNFCIRIKKHIGDKGELNINSARAVVTEINNFLYTNYKEIGITEALGKSFEYFSEWHRYWEKNYRDILNPTINEKCCEMVADALHNVFVLTKGTAFSDVYDTCGLTSEEICRVRFLTANQDFRGSRNFLDFAKIYNSDPSIFDEKSISKDAESFAKDINLSGLAQSDKRVTYAKSVANFLIELGIAPYEMLEFFNNDISALKTAIINIPSGGYGNKKADMFLRDMIVLGVWKNVKGFENIDVASDVNTIKVALRTGILRTEIPLVSSFLDIFCHQYGYIDDMSAKAWRRVWEIWKSKYPKETISSPCLLDYFVYNIVGKQFCKECLYIFRCTKENHIFKWHSAGNKTCQICYSKTGRRVSAKRIGQVIPCCDDEGNITIEKTKYMQSLDEKMRFSECPFKKICKINNNQHLEPPKSISITGQTGWSSAYAKEKNGGGGLMA